MRANSSRSNIFLGFFEEEKKRLVGNFDRLRKEGKILKDVISSWRKRKRVPLNGRFLGFNQTSKAVKVTKVWRKGKRPIKKILSLLRAISRFAEALPTIMILIKLLNASVEPFCEIRFSLINLVIEAVIHSVIGAGLITRRGGLLIRGNIWIYSDPRIKRAIKLPNRKLVMRAIKSSWFVTHWNSIRKRSAAKEKGKKKEEEEEEEEEETFDKRESLSVSNDQIIADNSGGEIKLNFINGGRRMVERNIRIVKS